MLGAGFFGEFAYALLLIPLLQHYLVFGRHLSVGLPGYVLAAYGFARLLAQVPLGGVADAIDHRLAVGIGYLTVLGAGLALWAPLPAAGLLAAAAVFGLGHALADPLIPAALAAGVSADERGRVLGLLNLAQVVGLVTGLAGGAFVAALAPAADGFLLVAAANALTLLLLIAGAASLLGRDTAKADDKPGASMWRGLLAERVIDILAVLFLLTLAANLLVPDLSLFAVQRLHSSLYVLTLYLIPASLAGVAALPAGGWLADRYGRPLPLIGGAAVGAIAIAALCYVRTPWEAGIAGVFGAAGLATTMPASNAALIDVADPEHRALLLSGMMAAQGSAEAVGPLLSGLLTQLGGAVLPFAGAAISLWLVVPGAVLFASAPHDGEPGEVVTYSPLTRFISRANIRAHAWRETR
ncbi:MAG TPA: MFS transporter, partial [Steroidobacteraceae bacterium]|nr:MFS transporter [Steroidobacteraceae bacterium]